MEVSVVKVDIDYKPPNVSLFAKEFAKKLKFVSKLLNLTVESVEAFETEKGYHVYVYFSGSRKLEDVEILVIQLALGSDYKRELYNMTRVLSEKYNGKWNVMFKYKNCKLNEKITHRAKIFSRVVMSQLYQ